MAKKWVKVRHSAVFGFLRPFFRVAMKRKYGFSCKRFKLEKGKPYLILSNHQSKSDQFLISLIFNRPLYFVARDDLFSMGFASKLIKFLVAPIPKNKVARDIKTIRDSMQVAKEGGCITLSPEGNLTFSGTTEYIAPSVVKYVKMLKIPVLFVNIRGGYGTSPRWAKKTRKGNIFGEVIREMGYEEYKDYSNEELYKIITDQLYIDDRNLNKNYLSSELAEYMECCVYVCPKCGLTHFVSKGDTITCTKCGYSAVYGDDLKFKTGEFGTVKDWYDYQKEFVKKFDYEALGDEPLFTDKIRVMKDEIFHKRKHRVSKRTTVKMYADRLEILDDFGSVSISLSDISDMAVCGRNKLEISDNERNNYFLIPTPRFNALKYVQFFYHYKNMQGETADENEFLGL
ncbi:MAG TPA: 1-acyl-sn-glycerol-3-phosphate acyltransferase [Clostridia bacterium]|nr:1-acyl-sn-glycerol-3-phosphate acyltransferase [Clostridia bacterium]